MLTTACCSQVLRSARIIDTPAPRCVLISHQYSLQVNIVWAYARSSTWRRCSARRSASKRPKGGSSLRSTNLIISAIAA